jgi:hypothetical protein
MALARILRAPDWRPPQAPEKTMKTLRYGALVAVVALVAIACGGSGGDADDGPQAPRLEGQQIADILDDPNVFLLDVRGADELSEQGAIEGYTLIPIDELAGRLDELPKDRPILTL